MPTEKKSEFEKWLDQKWDTWIIGNDGEPFSQWTFEAEHAARAARDWILRKASVEAYDASHNCANDIVVRLAVLKGICK